MVKFLANLFLKDNNPQHKEEEMIDEQPAKSYVSKNSSLSILDEAYTEEEYAFAVSKDNPTLTAAINLALEELEAEGTLTDIINNYASSIRNIITKEYITKIINNENETS